MIKTDAVVMQAAFQSSEVTISSERRTSLARKGQILYGKYCGTHGEGICSESFAEYHIWRGELVVARDFLKFLKAQSELLQGTVALDSRASEQLRITDHLIERIENLLGENIIQLELASELPTR